MVWSEAVSVCNASLVASWTSETVVWRGGERGVGSLIITAMAMATGGRNATASFALEIVAQSVPPASVGPLGVAKVNPSSKLVLEGAVGGPSTGEPCGGAWSLSSGTLAAGALADVASTSLATAADAAAGESVVLNLVIPADNLTPGGT